jgi:hypothetical protein
VRYEKLRDKLPHLLVQGYVIKTEDRCVMKDYLVSHDSALFVCLYLSNTHSKGSRSLQFVLNIHESLFFYLVCEAIGTTATPGLLCQPRMIVKMIVEKQMECT